MLTFNKKIMDISKILSNHRMSMALIGLSKAKFEGLLEVFTKIVIEDKNKQKRKRKIGGGRNGNIKNPKQKLFFILFYMKNYPTFDVAAFLFASSKTSTCDWVIDILPILEKALKIKLVLPKRQISTPEEFFRLFPGVREVMLDGVERPTIRSRKPKTQNKHYSGKKKRHTRKNLVLTDKRKILLLTPTKHGKVHDKKMSDKNMLASRIPEEIALLVDTGFQGIQKQHKNTLIPKKKPKGGFLTEVEKEMNRLISSTRISVEHAIGGMKRFRVASELFRNKKGIDDTFMLLSSGLWNLHIQKD
jgi:hypothetical protein